MQGAIVMLMALAAWAVRTRSMSRSKFFRSVSPIVSPAASPAPEPHNTATLSAILRSASAEAETAEPNHRDMLRSTLWSFFLGAIGM